MEGIPVVATSHSFLNVAINIDFSMEYFSKKKGKPSINNLFVVNSSSLRQKKLAYGVFMSLTNFCFNTIASLSVLCTILSLISQFLFLLPSALWTFLHFSHPPFVVLQRQSLEVFYKKTVLKNVRIFKEKHLCCSLYLGLDLLLY